MKKTIYSQEHKRLIGQLKQARKEAGLEQKEVAKLLATTQSYISKIESGQRRIDFVQLKVFAKIYKKPLSFFI
jgi:transcriptional regulator with XRE-family HTH domain